MWLGGCENTVFYLGLGVPDSASCIQATGKLWLNELWLNGIILLDGASRMCRQELEHSQWAVLRVI